MIWAIQDRVEVQPDRQDCGVFQAQIEEIRVDDRRTLAQHLVRMDDGRRWLISTEARGVGFATTCKQLHVPMEDSVVSPTRQDAIIAHFQQIADLVALMPEPDRAPEPQSGRSR